MRLGKCQFVVYSFFLLTPKLAVARTTRRSDMALVSALVGGVGPVATEGSCKAAFGDESSTTAALVDLGALRMKLHGGRAVLSDDPILVRSKVFRTRKSEERIIGRLNAIEQDVSKSSVSVIGYESRRRAVIQNVLEKSLAILSQSAPTFVSPFGLIGQFRRHIKFVKWVLKHHRTTAVSYFGANLPNGESLDQFFFYDARGTRQYVLVTFIRIRNPEKVLPWSPSTTADGLQDILEAPGVSGWGSG